MQRNRLFISIVIIAVTFALGLSYYWRPFVYNVKDEFKFSAAKVADDIKIISSEPHSIEHPFERDKVRDYLAQRLEGMGIKVAHYPYDSIKSRLNTSIKITNLYSKIDPPSGEATSYLLLVAHLDSRFRKKVFDKYVYSYGAADDGYGLGVILESVRLALLYRDDWKQGIKILFTDSEESDLDGIRKALSQNPEIFKNVGFVINLEARGVRGPALLFETSPGNRKIMELYKSARNPFTYSVTTAVYSILPNSTDFTLLKDSYPGMNFSVIDNLRYYHTELDNFSNISLNSIQHYGDQTEPVIFKYMTDVTYSNPESLFSEVETVFLTMPVIGFVCFSGDLYLIVNILTLFFLIFAVSHLLSSKKAGHTGIIRSSSLVLIISFLASLTGFCVAFLSALSTGQKYNLVNLPYVRFDWIIMIIALLTLALLVWRIYINRIARQRFNQIEAITGSIIIQFLLSVVLYVFIRENFFFLFPVIFSIVAMLFSIFTHTRYMYLIACILILLLLVPFYYAIIVALTLGSLPVFMLLASLLLSILIPLMDSFVRKLV
ncbi:MAG: hypothetical protein A2X18_13980 [Bacteroidetes bacterium GWF2_40_14]|nr:MAG: hypothetical protein A2X18_13980 [Bacteroidetes bacterium GWF2_40_14]